MSFTIVLAPGLLNSEEGCDAAKAAREKVREAAYHAVHKYPLGVARLAQQMGIPQSTLEKKVGRGTTEYQLTLDQYLDLQRLTGSAAILQAEASVFGCCIWRAIPDESQGDPVQAIMYHRIHDADFMRAVADPLSHGKPLSRNEVRRIADTAQDLHSMIDNLVSVMRKLMRPEPKREA